MYTSMWGAPDAETERRFGARPDNIKAWPPWRDGIIRAWESEPDSVKERAFATWAEQDPLSYQWAWHWWHESLSEQSKQCTELFLDEAFQRFGIGSLPPIIIVVAFRTCAGPELSGGWAEATLEKAGQVGEMRRLRRQQAEQQAWRQEAEMRRQQAEQQKRRAAPTPYPPQRAAVGHVERPSWRPLNWEQNYPPNTWAPGTGPNY